MTGPQLDYATPDISRTPASAKHAFAGVFAALVGGPGVAFGGLGIASITGNGPYAGLGGFLIGSLIGITITLIALIFGIIRSRSPDGRRRGFGIGLIIGSGLSLLAAGACFVGIR
jgi:hypothetical protein